MRAQARWIVLGAMSLGCAAGALATVRVVTRSPHFAVRTIRISPTAHVSSELLKARAIAAVGSNLFLVNLDEVAHAVAQEPWVASASARRELPSTVAIDVVERQPGCVVALGGLYLADAQGVVFKRATPEEATQLPVVTGIDREVYLAERERSQGEIREALAVLAAWRAAPSGTAARPAIGEVHVDRAAGLTVYAATDGLAVRLGRADQTLSARFARLDAVLASLQASGERPRLIHLDNRARPDRVTVRLAQATVGRDP